MAKRAALYPKLVKIDRDIERAVADAPSYRLYAEASELLRIRNSICEGLLEVGFEPWDAPIDMRETKVG